MEPQHSVIGERMLAEVCEQSAVVAKVGERYSETQRIVKELRRRDIRFVLFVARGTSANAATYGQYLASVLAGLPTGLASPSIVTQYRADIDLRSCLVIGISQSGETPDVADFLSAARPNAAATLAISNTPATAVTTATEWWLDCRAGDELSVVATKTYTSQLAVLALLFSTWIDRTDVAHALTSGLPKAIDDTITACLSDNGPISTFTREATPVIARGFNYATAREAALKLREAAQVDAFAYSGAEFLHGHIAAVDPGQQVLLFAYPGPTEDGLMTLLHHLRARGARTTVVGSRRLGEQATAFIPVDTALPELISPLLMVVPAQLLSYRLAIDSGLDPDQPRGLTKVTRTT